jgi:predicted DNA-binding mobile mystery protein A
MMLDDLGIRQLDRALGAYAAARAVERPRDGWLRAVREALGMSLRQLSERAGVSKTSAHMAEQNEARETVQLDTLRRLANALECDLVYALVPRDSLEAIVDRQARRIAEVRVGRVAESMEMEAQGVEPAERDRQVERLADDIVRDRGRGFWDVRSGA